MQVTVGDIQAVIDGGPIEIAVKCPLAGVEQWYIKQPDDWLHDMAQAIFDAKKALALAQEEIAEAKNLPPSEMWVRRQAQARESTQERIAELNEAEKQAPLTVEEDLERRNLLTYLTLLLAPSDYTRADEIAHSVARDQRNWYLLRNLIMDEKGRLLFKPKTEEGDRNWYLVGREFIESHLSGYVNRVLSLVQTAKNSGAGQNLS